MPEITHLNQKIRNMNNLKEFKKEGDNFENCQMNEIDILFKEYVEKKELVDCSAWNFKMIRKKFNGVDQHHYEYIINSKPTYMQDIEELIFKETDLLNDCLEYVLFVKMPRIKNSLFFVLRILEIAIMLFDEEIKEEIEELDRQQENHFNF